MQKPQLLAEAIRDSVSFKLKALRTSSKALLLARDQRLSQLKYRAC